MTDKQFRKWVIGLVAVGLALQFLCGLALFVGLRDQGNILANEIARLEEFKRRTDERLIAIERDVPAWNRDGQRIRDAYHSVLSDPRWLAFWGNQFGTDFQQPPTKKE